MVYGLRSFANKRRRRFDRKYPYSGAALNSLGKMTGMQKQINVIKSLINVEKKVLDTNADPTPSNTASIVTLSNVAQGDDYNQRNGRKIKADSIYLNGQVRIENTAAKETVLRVIIFIDSESDGETPTAAELLQDGTDLQSPLNYAYAGTRFKVLMDRYLLVSSNGPQNKAIKFYRKLGHHVSYLGTGATSGNMGTGNIYMLLMSNEPTNTPTFSYWARFRFIDN